MGRYHHLSIEEREDIMCMGREHRSLADIAAAGSVAKRGKVVISCFRYPKIGRFTQSKMAEKG